MQFHFLLLHGSVCVKGSHRANNGKQRTRLPGDLSFIKTISHKNHIRLKLVIIIPFIKISSRKGHIRLKLVIIMIRLKSAKLQTPIKFFLSELACQRHDALSSNGAVSNSQSTANFSDVTV